MPKRRSKTGIDHDKYVLAAELAHSIGVSPETVAGYARRRSGQWRGALRHVDGRNYVHIALAETYLKRLGLKRSAKRPKGWKTIKAVLAESGAGRSTFMSALRRGELRAVLAGSGVYVHPEDAESFVLAYKNLKPLPGWVMVSALPKELGRSKEAVNQWIRRNRDTVEVREFLHPTCNRPVPYISEADAERYRKIFAGGSDKHVGHAFTDAGSCRERVIAEVASRREPVSGSELAQRLGLAQDRCTHVLKELFDDGVLVRCGRGVPFDPFRYTTAPAKDDRDDA